MPLPSPISTWTALSSTVNQIKSPNRFLRSRISVAEETLPVETVEIGVLTGARDMAPFVRSGSEALMVGGLGEAAYVVKAPNIRIKKPMLATQLFDNARHVGSAAFPTSEQVISAVEQRVARDLQYMTNLIENAEEWMLAMALRAAISYSVADQETFTITFARSGSNTIDLTTHWDEVGNDIRANVRTVQRIVSEVEGGGITDVFLGQEAADQFIKNAAVIAQINTQANLNAGAIDLSQQYRDDGAIFLGRFMGLTWWEYPRTVNVNGSAVPLIRSKYAEFVSTGPGAGWTRFYGMIPDMSALAGGTVEAKRFAKSWMQEDPSAKIHLVHSRPLVVPKIPDTCVSMKVVSG